MQILVVKSGSNVRLVKYTNIVYYMRNYRNNSIKYGFLGKVIREKYGLGEIIDQNLINVYQLIGKGEVASGSNNGE